MRVSCSDLSQFLIGRPNDKAFKLSLAIQYCYTAPENLNEAMLFIKVKVIGKRHTLSLDHLTAGVKTLHLYSLVMQCIKPPAPCLFV